MKIRADVAELLRAGYSDSYIARQCHVDAKQTVRPARTALGLPKSRPGRRAAATVEDLFWRRAQPVDGGHFTWTGYLSCGTPVLRHGGRIYTAGRVAFRIKYHREPVGNVTSDCDVDGCVSPSCVADQPMREANRRADRAYAVIFGEAS